MLNLRNKKQTHTISLFIKNALTLNNGLIFKIPSKRRGLEDYV